MKTNMTALIALCLTLTSNGFAQSTSEMNIDLPSESTHDPVFYLSGVLGIPYSSNGAAAQSSPTGFSFGANAGVIATQNITIGGFYNESPALGSTALVRAGKRYGIESEYVLNAFENWSVGLGYRLGAVEVNGVTPFFPEGYSNNSIGHGPKLSLTRPLSPYFAMGLELAYFVYSNPQSGSLSVYGTKAGSALSFGNVIDANLVLKFML